MVKVMVDVARGELVTMDVGVWRKAAGNTDKPDYTHDVCISGP
jgi:hypothetical protein